MSAETSNRSPSQRGIFYFQKGRRFFLIQFCLRGKGGSSFASFGLCLGLCGLQMCLHMCAGYFDSCSTSTVLYFPIVLLSPISFVSSSSWTTCPSSCPTLASSLVPFVTTSPISSTWTTCPSSCPSSSTQTTTYL